MTIEAAEREIAKLAERLPDDITIRTIAEGFAALKAERDALSVTFTMRLGDIRLAPLPL